MGTHPIFESDFDCLTEKKKMSESEFSRMLRLKREERLKKYTDSNDPVHQLDTKVQAKRVPLLATENNSPSKKKTSSTTTIDPTAKAQRKEKLARLAANIRSMERADRGESPSPPPQQQQQQRKRTSGEGEGTTSASIEASPRKKKNSKWAALAAERQGWDADFKGDNVMETSTAIIVQKKEMKEQLSARHMVTAALARAGKEQAPALEQASAIEQLKKKRTKPKTEQEPNSVERSERVANLIAGWGTPVKTAPSTPRQDNLPAKVRETRLSETSPAKETESMETSNPDEPARLPRPKHLEAQLRRKSSDENEEEKKTVLETPNTKANREIADMKARIAAAQMELDEKRENEENSFTIEMDTSTPRLCSTQIIAEACLSEEEEENEPDEGGFEIEESTLVEGPGPVTSYQQGHSVTYIGQKFDFLRSEMNSMETSICELKEERAPEEIRRDTGRQLGSCYEAETPDKSKKKKRRSASFCISGSADDMVEFNAKSLQSFRRTQRVKRHEAKATAASVFSKVPSNDEIDLNAERKRHKAQIESQMNIIRQTSAALCVCTDTKHGKGSFTQVDAEKLLLVAMKKHEIAKLAIANLGKEPAKSISRGRVHVNNFVLKTRYQETFASPQYSNKVYWLMATLQIGHELHATHLNMDDHVKDVKEQKTVVIPCNFTFDNVPADFELIVTIYSIAIDRANPKRESKKETTGFKLFGQMFNQKQKMTQQVNPALFSPGGPNAVRKSNFKAAGAAKIDLKTAQKYDQFKLTNTPWDSMINSVMACKIEPKFAQSFQFESFITVRSGSGGYGDWIRYWGVLSNDRITFWKYPEDKDDLPAEGHISLRTVLTPVVKAANRTMTKRPNTIELYQAQPKSGSRKNPAHIEGIVSDYDQHKLVRFLLSADNGESKNEWIKSLNQMLQDLRAWERSLPTPIEDTLE